jgi:hypothetical protein
MQSEISCSFVPEVHQDQYNQYFIVSYRIQCTNFGFFSLDTIVVADPRDVTNLEQWRQVLKLDLAITVKNRSINFRR